MFIAATPRPRIVTITRQEARSLAAVCVTGDRTAAALLLAVSPHTLGRHLSLAFERLRAESILEAAWRLGWLEVPAEELEVPAAPPSGVVWIRNLR